MVISTQTHMCMIRRLQNGQCADAVTCDSDTVFLRDDFFTEFIIVI